MSTLLRRHIPKIGAFRSNASLSRHRIAAAGSSSSKDRSIYTTVSLIALSSITAYTIGSIYPPSTLRLLFPPLAPPPPADQTAPEVVKYLQKLEATLQSLPLLQKHRREESGWYETRPYESFPVERAVNNLTAGALRGAGKLALAPIARVRDDESESWIFVHLGRGLCGHDGIIHGGLIATVMDESLARTAINNFPERVGVTANLNIHYKAPTSADQFVVIKTKLDDLKGRKALVSARMEDLDGNLLVEATATFVQPRYASLLNTAVLRKAMGEPPASAEEGEPEHPHRVPILLADAEDVASRKDRQA